MYNPLLIFRVLTFAVFIVSNAIICSVGAWSLSIAQATSYSSAIMQLAGYLIFLGAFALVFVFPLLFVEIMRHSPRTSMVWFELAWTGFFWLLEFIGAVTLSAQWPNRKCMPLPGTTDNSPCHSINVLLAFTWICAITLLLYFITLIVSATLHHSEDPQVWRATVAVFPWYQMKHALPSPKAASSMFLPQKRKVSIVAPKPRRAAPSALFAYRAGMNSEYEIEHYREQRSAPRDDLPVPPIPAQQAYSSHRSGAAQNVPPVQPSNAPSFYPQAVLTAPNNGLKHPAPAPTAPPPPPPAKPVGDWPRLDASTTQRQKSGRQIRYQTITRPSTTSPDGVTPSEPNVAPTSASSAPLAPPLPKPNSSASLPPTQPPTQPQGPRTQTTSRYQRSRPPPLDLSAVRAYDSSRSRR